MSHSFEQDREEFQRELDALANNAILPLMPREYAGPIVVNQALVIDGQRSTIWATRGPVVSLRANGVTLRNLRLEVTGEGDPGEVESHCALKVERGYIPNLENVEVRGTVIGIPAEEGDWSYPHSLQIGAVPFGSEHDLIMRIWVPVPAQISSMISGLEVQPHRLEPGTNEVTIHIERIAKDTLLSGSLYLSTPHLKRSIALNGYVSTSKAKRNRSKKPVEPRIIYQPADWDTLTLRPRPTPPAPAAPTIQSTSPPELAVIKPIAGPKPTESPVREAISEGLGKPSGPSIRWPPATPVSPVLTPVPLVEPPIPFEQPTLVPESSTGQSRIGLPNQAKRIIIMLLVLAVLGIGVFAYRYFTHGSGVDPDKIGEWVKLFPNTGARAVAFSPDGKTLASSNNGEDGIVILWNVDTKESKPLSPKRSEITSLSFSGDGTKLAAGTANGSVIIWKVSTNEELPLNFRHHAAVNSVAFSPNGNLIVSGGDDQICVWNVQTGKQLVLGSGKNTKAVAFSPDGETIASGDEDGFVKLWDATSGKENRLSMEHSGPITSLAFSNGDGAMLASASKDMKVIIWEIPAGKKRFPSPYRHGAEVSALAFSNDNKILATRSAGNVYLLDIDSPQPKRTLAAGALSKASSNGVAISSNGCIASGSSDGYLILWKQQ